ncbi:hypothetical protein QS460_00380 [Liquorilactobacillus mali]|uniref:hypothetical protein n=1 Tax=Liquorilactobacillus mali TaxID=1618 RepID=UPI000704DCFE|nr:hypothetical protein [Liquorilactobacillus mali]MDN7144372.1 hypothetical protein [Liquorilactobacillus mali]
MLELKKTTLQQVTQNIQKQFTSYAKQDFSNCIQMPIFQLNYFINQAIQKHKVISISYKDIHDNEFVATGFISRNKNNKTILKLDSLGDNLSHLLNINQIKYIKLAKR